MKRRPLVVTCLSLVVLTFSILQFAGLSAWYRLPELAWSVPGWYLPGKSLVLGVGALVGSVGLFSGKLWSTRVLHWLAVLYLVWFWADRLIIRSASFTRQALPLYGTLISLACLLILWMLGWESTRAYVEEPLV
jgi:hypothetical protein